MSKTGYIEIASRLVTVARSCFSFEAYPEIFSVKTRIQLVTLRKKRQEK
jgi:hypothetical protein